MNELLCSLVPHNNETEEESKEQRHQEVSLPVSSPTSIRNIAICSLREKDKSKQEIMSFLLHEKYVSGFSYTSINSNNHNFSILGPRNENVHQDYFFPHLFDHYDSRPPNLNEMVFLRFCKKYTATKQGGLILGTNQTVVLDFTFRSNDSDAIYYHLY